ncbi:hypothetical protein [Maricaulis sp.]|uniref:hypothetical protein n=1 Tax=Maricaulis sp. TaxID=1486257 RepID=UPI0026385A75|nr:hypothetical protein [Maricaulis sp.]
MRIFGVAALAMLAGCTAEVSETVTTPEAAAPASQAAPEIADVTAAIEATEVADVGVDLCRLSAQRRWDYAEGLSVTIDAAVFCENGQRVARRDIVGADGERLYEFSAPAEHVAILAWAESDEAFFAAFAEWVDKDPWRTRTSDLPAYDEGAEFPFYPATEDRAQFDAWRAGDHPIDCFVQGMESLMCVAMIDGEAVEMGVQSFPG